MNDKKDIRSLTLEEIIQFCEMQNLPKFRAKQIWEWLWSKRVHSFEEITSISKKTRRLFNDHFLINPIKIHLFFSSL